MLRIVAPANGSAKFGFGGVQGADAGFGDISWEKGRFKIDEFDHSSIRIEW
jgi:hypothetical protein